MPHPFLVLKVPWKKVEYAWNMISHISGPYFDWCRKLKVLYVNNNQLLVIPNIRSISNSIMSLSFDGNNISSWVPMYGIYFPRLHGLQINSNRMTCFCFLPAHFAPRLRDVYLESNNLSGISFSDKHSSLTNND